MDKSTLKDQILSFVITFVALSLVLAVMFIQEVIWTE